MGARSAPMLKIQRAYETPEPAGGMRVLFDRMWPRGRKKETARIDLWLKDVAPSTELRTWFAHDPSRWQAFQRRYFAELDHHAEAWQPIVEALRSRDVVLVYAARDKQHNNALALQAYLKQRL